MPDFVTHVESLLAREDGDKLTASALASFLSAVRSVVHDSLTEEDLRLWVAAMMLGGLKHTTRKRYFARVKSLYVEWSSDGSPNPFDKVGDAIDADFDCDSALAEANLEIVRRLLAKTKDSTGWEYINAFLYLLYNAEATLADVIRLKFDDPVPNLPQVSDIVDAMRASRQLKYVFGLNRGAKREPQLQRELVSGLNATLQTEGMKFDGEFSRKSITAIWIAAALRCRIPLRELRSMVKAVPDEYAFLSLIAPEQISEDRKNAILKTVADSICKRTTGWFVMRMRQGNTPETIKDVVKYKSPDLFGSLMFYYPTHVSYRFGKGKKKKRVEIPYIPGLLFFRARQEQVALLFSKIGDMAWCMKETNSPGARYAVISRQEMSNFQKYVGKFTDDIRIEIADANSGLARGRMVLITAGVMQGYQGRIEDIGDDKGTRTFFLQITNDQALRWTAQVDEAFIKPLDQ